MAGVVVVFAVLAGGFLAVRIFGSDGNSGHSGDLTAGRYLQHGDVPGGEPEEVWSERHSCPFPDESYTSCESALGDKALFVVEGDEDDVRLQAYSRSDGSQEWDVDLVNTGRVAVFGDTVVVEAYDSGGDRNLLTAFDANDGEEKWEEKFDDVSIRYFDVGGGNFLVQESRDNGVQAVVLELDDGSEAWSERGQVANQCGSSLVLVDEEELSMVDATSGDEAWKVDLRDDYSSGNVGCIDGGIALVDDEQVIALSSKDGEEVWSERVPGSEYDILATQGGQVMVGGDDTVVAFSEKDGSETWDEKLDTGDDVSISSGRIVDSGLLLAFGGEEAVILDPATGKERASTRLADATMIEFATNALLVADGEELVAYDLSSLDERWAIDAEGVGEIAAGDGQLFLVDNEHVTRVG